MTNTKAVWTTFVLVTAIALLTASNFATPATARAAANPTNAGCSNIKASNVEISQCSRSATCSEDARIAVCSGEAGLAVNDPGADGPKIVVKPHK
jgi:hypothetical protein